MKCWNMARVSASFGEALLDIREDVIGQSYPFPGRLSDFEALIVKVAYPSVVDPGQMVELWAQRRSGSTVLQVQRSHPRQYGNGAITIPAASEDSEATVILPRL